MSSLNTTPLTGLETIRANQGGEPVWLNPLDIASLLDKAGAFTAFVQPIIKPILDARGILRPIAESEFPRLPGETDDTGMVQRAANWAADNHTGVAGIPNRRYILSDAVTWNPIYATLLAQGAGFLQTVGGKNGFNIDQTSRFNETGIEHAFRSNAIRHFDGFSLIGLSGGQSNGGDIALNLKNPSAGLNISNFRIDDWGQGFQWDDKAFIQTFNTFEITHCYKLGIFPSIAGADSGERLAFINGTLSNSKGGFDFNKCQVYMHNISFDYITGENGIGIDCQSSADVFITQSHLEWGQASQYVLRANGGSSINLASNSIIAADTKGVVRTEPWFFADPVSRSSVNFIGVNRVGSTGAPPTTGYGQMPAMVRGPGTSGKMVFYNPGLPIPPSHTQNNLLQDGPAGAAALRDWKNTSSTSAAFGRTTTAGEVISGSASFKFAPVAGATGRIELLLRIIAQDPQIFLAGMLLAQGTPTEPFTVGYEFRAAMGEVVGSGGNYVISAATLTSAYATAAAFRSQPAIAAPVGAAFCRITMNKGAFDAASNGVGQIEFDDLILEALGCQIVASGEPGYPGWNTRQINASNTPINMDDTVFVDTSTGAVSLGAPGGIFRPGSRIRFVDKAGTWGTNNFTWNPGSQGVRGSTAAVIHNTNWQSITYEYNGTTWVQV